MFLLRAFVAMTLLWTVPVWAQDAAPASEADLSFGSKNDGPRGLWFTALLGVQSGSAFFGSDEIETGATFSPSPIYLGTRRFSLGDPEFLDDPRERDLGFGLRGSFRFIGGRDAEEYDALEGLDDIDPTLEVGLGLAYTMPFAEAFADVRYGLGGSDGWVGELGADFIARPNDRLALRAGPRLLYGSDNYVDTYFGVSPDEGLSSGLSSYDPDSGLVSAGVEFTATYRLGDRWWLEGGARYDRFQDDAADSPIVQDGSDENTSVHIGLRRAFVLDF